MGFDAISLSALSDPTPNSIHPHHLDINLATSSINHRGPPSATSPPGLVSPSQPYSSSPSVLDLTPPTPLRTLDAFQFPSSAPPSPYVPQRSPWYTSNLVRILPSLLSSSFLSVLDNSNHLRSQSVHSASANGDPWCHRSGTSPTLPVTDVAT
jgi:hypothetical protein